MKCEICQCDTYVAHVNDKHEKVCTKCYIPNKKDIIDKWETDKKRIGCIR